MPLMPPPVEVPPHAKAALDVLFEAEQRKRTRRRWLVWISALFLSLSVLVLFNHGVISGPLGSAFAVGGIVGVFLFLAFLSTKVFGRSNSSVRWWWIR